VISESAFIKRIVIGKSLGFAVGLLGFFLMPVFVEQMPMMPRLGLLCWYTTFGCVVAMVGCLQRHPLLGFSMPWWFTGSVVGAWLNLVLALMFYETLEATMVGMFGEDGFLRSPFWVVLEGVIVGVVIAFAADLATNNRQPSTIASEHRR
jgi:hypothetical protein